MCNLPLHKREDLSRQSHALQLKQSCPVSASSSPAPQVHWGGGEEGEQRSLGLGDLIKCTVYLQPAPWRSPDRSPVLEHANALKPPTKAPSPQTCWKGSWPSAAGGEVPSGRELLAPGLMGALHSLPPPGKISPFHRHHSNVSVPVQMGRASW